MKAAISEHIVNKQADLVGQMEAQGTTPRRLTDLIGSLSDLTSGSGDKGTPIIFIQGYFDNYTHQCIKREALSRVTSVSLFWSVFLLNQV